MLMLDLTFDTFGKQEVCYQQKQITNKSCLKIYFGLFSLLFITSKPG